MYDYNHILPITCFCFIKGQKVCMMKLMMKGVSYNQLVSNLSCTISTGITYIVGKNGSGKSTFLKLCATAIEPSEGSVEYIQMIPGAGTQ